MNGGPPLAPGFPYKTHYIRLVEGGWTPPPGGGATQRNTTQRSAANEGHQAGVLHRPCVARAWGLVHTFAQYRHGYSTGASFPRNDSSSAATVGRAGRSLSGGRTGRKKAPSVRYAATALGFLIRPLPINGQYGPYGGPILPKLRPQITAIRAQIDLTVSLINERAPVG